MPTSGRVLKRVVVGRAMRSDRLGETLLSKRLALPIFASDALSSVAYAPDEIFLTLGLAGGSLALTHSWQIGLCVVVVMLVVVASYRQNVHAYPSGGGDYEVATTNLGPRAGLTVASALLVDYVLTVAVSISSGVQNAAAALPFIRGHEAVVAVGLVVLLTGMNLRGVRESGKAFAVPVYAFMASVIGMGLVGLFRQVTGTLPEAESAALTIRPESGFGALGGLAMMFLLLRAFSSGCAALTGVEAISNGVPAFQKPKSRNAATTLLMMGLIAITMLMSMLMLAKWTGIKYAEDPQVQLIQPNGAPVPDGYVQDTIMGQVAKAVFDGFPPGVVVVSIVAGVILILAANTAFNGFPVLASILAKDAYLPRQLHTRGDRLAFSNGILILAGAAAFLIVIYDAEVTKLIQLYIVGVFVSFNLSQLGMIRHWTRHLKSEEDPGARRKMFRSRLINSFGLAMTASVFVVVLLTKFLAGAWIAILAMIVFYAILRSIRAHYDRVAEELVIGDSDQMMPTRVHAIVLVSKLHKPTMRALAYAKASRPNVLEAVFVDTDGVSGNKLLDEWDAQRIDVPLKMLYSPYREVIRPIVDYAVEIREANPRGVVAVYIPEYVVGRWWEQVLHNQTALRLKGRLLFTPGVMVTSVPYQLRGAEVAKERDEWEFQRARPGDVRRGRTRSGR